MLSVLVHNIRSMHNVGAIFRTSDGAGVSHIYLTGYTPYPPRKEIAKTFLGAENFISWNHDTDPIPIIKRLKKEGTAIVLLEQLPNSIPHHQIANHFKKTDNILLIVGSEIGGINQDIINLADIAIEIPMHGQKENLNVSVAFGIAIYQISSL